MGGAGHRARLGHGDARRHGRQRRPPRIGTDLNASLAALQWTVNAYLLTLAALILLGGSLGDRYGRRRVFLIGVCWFAAASALCAAAPNIEVLIFARALQGVGGALLTPGSLAMLQAVFHPDDRAGAVGAWSGLGGVAAAVGPFLGGWLVDGPGWRWIFLLNVPLAAVVVLVTARHVPETRDPADPGHFDVLGATLAALSLAGVTYALTEGLRGGRWSPGSWGSCSVSPSCSRNGGAATRCSRWTSSPPASSPPSTW